MKAKTIIYKRVFALGNFQNEQIGIEIELEDGEKATDALDKAKKWVEENRIGGGNNDEYQKAKHISEHPDDYLGREVKWATTFLNNYSEDELPF